MNQPAARLSRRRFLRRTLRLAGSAMALPALVPCRVLAAPGRPGANDRIGIGFIGLGARAQQIFAHLTEEVQVTGVCDVYAPRVAEATKSHRCAGYEDDRQLLENGDVDAVIITTPDHWHALQTIHACQAGKDVFCEKPLSLTVQAGRAMVEAVRQHQRICQVGPQQRSW